MSQPPSTPPTPEEISNQVNKMLREGGWDEGDKRREALLQRYTPAVNALLTEIADTYLDGIKWRIVGRDETTHDWFQFTVEYRWHLLTDVGGRHYLTFAVEMLEETNTLGFRAHYASEPESVKITNNAEVDMEKLRTIALKAFAEGRAGKIRVERHGLLSPTYTVMMQTAQGEVGLISVNF